MAANALTGKKKKRKAGRQTTNQTNQTISRDQTVAPVLPPEETIDPDEPTYCLCDQISYGEMIMCDNDSCSIEWFHFSCVSLLTKPKGNYYKSKSIILHFNNTSYIYFRSLVLS